MRAAGAAFSTIDPLLWPFSWMLYRTMKTILTAFFAITATLFTAVNGATLTLVPFYEVMSQGDHVILAEHGPFTFSCSCDSSAVSG